MTSRIKKALFLEWETRHIITMLAKKHAMINNLLHACSCDPNQMRQSFLFKAEGLLDVELLTLCDSIA